jgi:transcriptional regulator with XRE-family HTH domain
MVRKLNNLRLARLRAGLSQIEASLAVGFSHTTISLLERELKKPEPRQLERLAKAYNTTVAELQEGPCNP